MTRILRVFSMIVVAFAIVIVLWPVISNKSDDRSKADLEVAKVADAIAEAGNANAVVENEKEVTQYSNILRAVSVRGPLLNPFYLRGVFLSQDHV